MVYAPALGRFGSEDSAKDGLNWYTYCGNNPLSFTNPSGYFSLPQIFGGSITMALGAMAMTAAMAAATVATGGLALAIAGATFLAGGGLTVFGAYEVTEGLTGRNDLRNLFAYAGYEQGYYDSMTLLSMGSMAGMQYSAEYAYMHTYVPQGLVKEGLGDFSGKSYSVTREGIDTIKTHFDANNFNAPENYDMLNRLEKSLYNGKSITGADASFYFHELKESSLMRGGMGYYDAHQIALDYYGVSQFSVYHPYVIQANSQSFSAPWFDFWNIYKW